MFKLSAADLAKRSVFFRYTYYVVSSFRLRSFNQWQQDGEPNPFVAKTYARVSTERTEFADVFGEFLTANQTHRR